MRFISFIVVSLFACGAHAELYCTVICDTPPPAQSATRIVAAAPVGYDATRPYTEWAPDFAPLGYGEFGKIISRRYVDGPTAQAAPPLSAQSSLPPPMPLQYAPPISVSAEPAAFNYQQCTSGSCPGGNCGSSFSLGGSRCGPGGCR